jgi:VIT1/CCC1 family predicted Fe2+/Mn2+ transporter
MTDPVGTTTAGTDRIEGHEPRGLVELIRHYVGDLVYGANDGIITTFAVVSGVTGASLAPRIVVILGVANLLADGFSMGASNFLALRSKDAALRAVGSASLEPFPLRHGLVTFGAFVVAGVVPLGAYMFGLGDLAFPVAVVATLVTLFGVGASRALVTDGGWIRSGLEMLVVGAVAAGVAFWVGGFVSGFG